MHFNADHTKLYVACGDDDVIDILDVANARGGRQARRPDRARKPSPWTRTRRRIYVSDEEVSSLAIIDMDQNIIEKEVPTGAEPEGVMVSEDGKTVYVTSEVGDLVHPIDADGGYVTQDVVVGTRPRRFAATPDGKELWVSTELSGEVYIIDRQKFVVTGKIDFLPPGMRKTDVTPVGLVMTKDGKTAYVTLGHAAHVAVVDVPTRKVQGYILVGKRSWGITLSRDEKTLYVANGFGDDITIIDRQAARRSFRFRSAAFRGASSSMSSGPTAASKRCAHVLGPLLWLDWPPAAAAQDRRRRRPSRRRRSSTSRSPSSQIDGDPRYEPIRASDRIDPQDAASIRLPAREVGVDEAAPLDAHPQHRLHARAHQRSNRAADVAPAVLQRRTPARTSS